MTDTKAAESRFPKDLLNINPDPSLLPDLDVFESSITKLMRAA